MPGKTLLTSRDILQICLPGTLRFVMSVYVPESRAYHPVPRRCARIVVDTPEQADIVWRAVVKALQDVGETLPDVGEAVPLGYGLAVDPRADEPDETPTTAVGRVTTVEDPHE